MFFVNGGRRNRNRRRSRGGQWVWALSALALLVLQPRAAHALIRGGEGNSPLNDPGWPQGAAAVFNVRHRVSWWEGPPFGGGQWHAECRGDAAALNAVLQDFAKIDVKQRRIVVHDGGGRSFWLNPNREQAKEADAAIDWVFMVWVPDNWQRLHGMPARVRPRDGRPGDEGPVPQIDVFAGGRINWADVKVPEGIEVIDERLEAHGYALTDGTVLEGTVVDLASGAPLPARMRLELIEPQPTGGYRYTPAGFSMADRIGKWVLKKAPAGWYRIVVEADGYVARVLGFGQLDDQPKWHEYRGGLSKPGPVAGRVTDESGQPLPEVQVRLHDMFVEPDGLYESPDGFEMLTDAEGKFHSDAVPIGTASVWIHKPGYVRPGLGPTIQTPADDIQLTMVQAAKVQVVVDFTATTRPEGYIVEMAPEEGATVGKWSGSGNIDASGAISFDNVPPGRYVLKGRPNPGNAAQETEPTTVDLAGGKTTDVVLKAK